MRTLVFFTIVVVAYATYIWVRRRNLPKNFKDMCICGHSRITHSTGSCDFHDCICPAFFLNKGRIKKHNSYFWREEGPAAAASRGFSRIVVMILVAFVPRHIFLDWAQRLKEWLRKEEEIAEKEEEKERNGE